ncbi:hypothetical protein DICSQDRAFT_165613 [Dichomitus squalens LYAD-421 SS1]|uniref:rRNA-processing protein FYV7 n=1 Tax=Dichomitus squalens TaxID=114155 RepID=A0A4Q9N9E2_9APHY|nr:uncharacterized protein DICSQDRAFT_165613 [Dichomitus squalens LYAD-421 SS1]EJF65911.1 hypothetical protein DICSQDRAFT_165613 [Dichomitus squalens LYAD-421 SS1]TBU35921.1 hypothetical protein BD311DRAFT_744848 [Dichomitus squalens]TBU65768.1 hypothetical protein BD310DRAFT_971844 [Dichomitus squalens]
MSPSSATQENRGVKRKKPPTFQHLPVQRAKKLKRSWVEVQKIKSKWKAQKRKEGLVASRQQLARDVDANDAKGRGSDEDQERDENEERTIDAGASSDANEESEEGSSDEASDSESEESSVDEHTQRPNATTASPKRPTLQKREKGRPQKPADEQLSLRELQRMAYSRASLHTHKSDPLHRHRGAAPSQGRGDGRGGEKGRRRGGRGGERGARGGAHRGRGRGQPDMGLRMKAMLEKIKQDYT